MGKKTALIIVDVQKDFCPGGALSVQDGDMIIPNLNKYTDIFIQKRLPVFFTRDWHPEDTGHFKRCGGLWPDHCVQNTPGAELHQELRIPKEAKILSKGMDPDQDSYSAFDCLDDKNNNFLNLLRDSEVEALYVGGLATDYCVKSTVLDALKAGFSVNILADAIKGVDLKPGDSQSALDDMVSKGADLTTIDRLDIP